MGYQKFFSPNGDGNNEYWNIIGAELFPDANIFIYDRYGKLLQQLSPESIGWNGTYLGQLMPATDYWFRFEYDNGKVFTGHFALKR
jgi:gliding motility-associated-like protein